MARQGDALENSVTGERLVFRRTTADSGGAVLLFDYFLRAGGSVPLAHVHPRQEERFEIVSGRARIRVGRRRQRAKPARASWCREVRSTGSGTTARTSCTCSSSSARPCAPRKASSSSGLGRDGKLGRHGFPHPLQIAVMAKEYRDEAQFPFLPAVVQRALIAPLAAIGAPLGYRAF